MTGRLCAVLIAVIGPCLAATAEGQQAAACAGHLATIEANGQVSGGSREAVRAAFRSGLPIRIGWSIDANGDNVPDVAHWADASFLTEFQGEVFAQFESIQRQTPMRDGPRIPMPAGPRRWTGLIGTTGVLESHSEGDQDAEPLRVRAQWCIDPRASACAAQWRLVYLHGPDGTADEGSKSALFDAVRRGYPIRLAWGTTAPTGGTVEHAADPVFATIINGTELAVQLPEHIAQASYWDLGKATFDKPSVVWRGLMKTTGAFDAVLVDRATGEEVRRLPQQARLAWFALAPDLLCAPPPLELAVPDGVRRR